MTNEKELQKQIVQYLKENLWEVKEYVPRKDCLTWEHPYQADLLIRHNSYPKIGWIGIEIKDHHKIPDAFQQVITKYQNHYFDSITQPINLWALMVNHCDVITSDSDWKFLQKFGIGLVKWNHWREQIIFNHSESNRCSIFLNPLKRNETDEDLLLSFCLDKCKWVKSINKENMGFLAHKEFKEVKKNGKLLFEFA